MTNSGDQRLLRLSAGYVLDQLATARLVFDIVDALITVAAGQANVAKINASPELQRLYATYDRPPPDDIRRPISINALALSLRLPFETVRRRLIKLSLLGVCRFTRAGIVVPSQVLFAPVHQTHLDRNERLTAELWRQTSSELPAVDQSDDAPVWIERPVRIASRVSLDYVLRLADQLGEQFGDPTHVAVAAAMIEANGAPMKVPSVARRVQLSAEKVRRRLHELAEKGVVRFAPSGVIVSPEFMTSGAIERIAARNRGDLSRLFTTLRELGVISNWQSRALDRAA